MFEYGLIENEDYATFHKIVEANNAVLIDYALTLDASKELSRVEGNAKGTDQESIICFPFLGEPDISTLNNFMECHKIHINQTFIVMVLNSLHPTYSG